jgi:hypothetical protein
MSEKEKWAEQITKKVITSKEASKGLKNVFETADDDDYLYSLFGTCENIEQMNKVINDIECDDAASEAEEIIKRGLYDAAAMLMDDDLREEIHCGFAPCSDFEFLTEYIIRHKLRFGEDFVI